MTSAAADAFNGKVRWVQIDLGDDAPDADHYITPKSATASPPPFDSRHLTPTRPQITSGH
jgi:hypothetical protein